MQDVSAVAWGGDWASCRAPGWGLGGLHLLPGPSALLCCTGRVLSAWFGVIVLVPFLFPVSTVQDSPRPPLPLFYILSFTPVLSKPRQCVHSVPLGVRVHLACPPPRWVCSQARPPSTFIHLERLCLLLLAQPRRLDNLYRTLFIMVLSLEGSDPLSPSSSLQLV